MDAQRTRNGKCGISSMSLSNEPQANRSTNHVDSSAAPLRDPVIEAHKKDVDRTLLRENLKLTVAQRFEKFQRFAEYASELREAGRRARSPR
jgi:hypothetical protein